MSVKAGDAVVLNSYTLTDTGMKWREDIDGPLVGRIAEVLCETIARPREWVHVKVGGSRTTWPISAMTVAQCPACMRPLTTDVAAVSLYCSSRCRRMHAKRMRVPTAPAPLAAERDLSTPALMQASIATGQLHPALNGPVGQACFKAATTLPTPLTSNCGHCRATFAVPSGAGSTKRYCSATCRGRASEAQRGVKPGQAKAQVGKPLSLVVEYTLKPLVIAHTCALPGCLNDFVRAECGRPRRFCSRKCLDRAKTLRRRKPSAGVKQQTVATACTLDAAARIPCTVCRTPAKASLSNRAPHCSADCRAYSEYIAGARFYAVRIGRRQGGYVRIDTVEVKK